MENILLIILIIFAIVFLVLLIWPIIDFIKVRKEIKNEKLEKLKEIENEQLKIELQLKEIEKNQINELVREVERLGRIIKHLTKDKEILVYEKKNGCISKDYDICSVENYYRVTELKSGIEFVLDEKLNLKTPVTRIDLVEKAKKMILKEENK